MNYKFLDEGGKHLHTLNGEPLMGTSTILKEVFPPYLAWWAAGCAVKEFGWLDPRDYNELDRFAGAQEVHACIAGMDAGDYRNLLETAHRAHDKKKKAEGKKGTAAHKEVEDYIRKCLAENEGRPLPADGGVKQFAEWALLEVGRFAFTEAHVCSEKLWVGGIIDFAYWGKQGKFIVADRKTSKDIYPTHFYQTSGYGLELKESGPMTADGDRLPVPNGLSWMTVDGYAIFQQKGDGEARVMVRDDVAQLEEAFRWAVWLYKDKKNIGYAVTNQK